MTHFGIICPTATGHLNPMTTLGYELKQRGHRVTLVGVLDAEKSAASAGLEFSAIAASECPLGTTAQLFSKLGELSGVAALRYTLKCLQDATAILLQHAPKLIKNANIDALIVDQTSPAGGSVAEHLGIPFVSVSAALVINEDFSVPPFNTPWNYSPAWWARARNRIGYQLIRQLERPFREIMNAYRCEWNLSPLNHQNDAYSRFAQLSQQPVEFEFPRENLPACFHFTGAYHNIASRPPIDFPFKQLTGQPLIYASMGTLQNRLVKIFEAIAEACVDLDVQLVMSLGSEVRQESLPEFPGSPLVVGHAPQLELLQKASLTITHAGLNTALESISHGVPMVAIPIANDQPGVAARIVWTGCGERVKLSGLNTSKLRTAIEQVLAQDSYRKNAIRLKNANQESGGVVRAADIIEQVVLISQRCKP